MPCSSHVSSVCKRLVWSGLRDGAMQCGADNLLVILVLVAIITGIVIDSFGARREQDDDRSDQLANSCECNAAVVYWVPLSLATAVTAAAVACGCLSNRCCRHRPKASRHLNAYSVHAGFICGKSRNEFEHLGLDFNRHQKRHHNMWTYLAFFMHLHLDDDENFGAGELKVSVTHARARASPSAG
jgi:hypothetical protein